jgi:hypothetical protein
VRLRETRSAVPLNSTWHSGGTGPPATCSIPLLPGATTHRAKTTATETGAPRRRVAHSARAQIGGFYNRRWQDEHKLKLVETVVSSEDFSPPDLLYQRRGSISTSSSRLRSVVRTCSDHSFRSPIALLEIVHLKSFT